jgi:hypothetical protein
MRKNRPSVVIAAAISQSLVVIAVLFAWLALVFWGSSRIGSILVATIFLGIPLLLSVAAVIGLWRGTTIGWWTAVIFDFFGICFVALCMRGGHLGLQTIVEAILVLVPLVLLCLPSARDFYDVPHRATELLSTLSGSTKR